MKIIFMLNEVQATVVEMKHTKREIWLKYCKLITIRTLHEGAAGIQYQTHPQQSQPDKDMQLK